MILEWLQTFPLDHNAGIITISIIVYCLSMAGLIIYSLQEREDDAENLLHGRINGQEQETSAFNGLTDSTREETVKIEAEAEQFYSHPATLRYRFSPHDSLERLRNLRKKTVDPAPGELKNEELSSFSTLSIFPEIESGEPLYDPLLSSISFPKSRREKTST